SLRVRRPRWLAERPGEIESVPGECHRLVARAAHDLRARGYGGEILVAHGQGCRWALEAQEPPRLVRPDDRVHGCARILKCQRIGPHIDDAAGRLDALTGSPGLLDRNLGLGGPM